MLIFFVLVILFSFSQIKFHQGPALLAQELYAVHDVRNVLQEVLAIVELDLIKNDEKGSSLIEQRNRI